MLALPFRAQRSRHVDQFHSSFGSTQNLHRFPAIVLPMAELASISTISVRERRLLSERTIHLRVRDGWCSFTLQKDTELFHEQVNCFCLCVATPASRCHQGVWWTVNVFQLSSMARRLSQAEQVTARSSWTSGGVISTPR